MPLNGVSISRVVISATALLEFGVNSNQTRCTLNQMRVPSRTQAVLSHCFTAFNDTFTFHFHAALQVQAEKDVSFDNGPDGSVAEDCFFAMRAYAKGYSFDFIEGEMYEKSPFTLLDFLQQRKRWLQGILLVVRSAMIPWRYKCFLAVSVYSWCTMPLSSSNIVLAGLYPIPCPDVMDFLCAFIAGVQLYMYVFGVLKSFSLHRFGVFKCAACAVGALCTIPVNIVIENAAVIWGMVGKKHKFYVVQKDVKKAVTVV